MHLWVDSIMLQTYQAELQGSQLIWLDEPPVAVVRERVVVILERSEPTASPNHAQAFEQARGCLGKSARETVLQQLEHLRQDWQRNPIEGFSVGNSKNGQQ